MTEFISPNLHPLLVHYPIALLVTGTVIEVFSFLGWRRHPLRAAGRWMILLGALSGVVAVTSGIYAIASVARAGVPENISYGSWHQWAGSSPLIQNAPAWKLMVRHLLLESIGTGVLLLATISWIAFSDRLRLSLAPACLVLLLVGVGLMGTGAYFSGEGIYRHGVGVDTQSVTPAARSIEYYLPPVEAHAIGAGVVISLAALSIGLSIRTRVLQTPSEGIHGIAAALGGSPVEFPEDANAVPVHIATADELAQRVPSSRFALLTALVALLTAAGGWWVLASGSSASVLAFKDLWNLIRDPAQNNGAMLTRRLAHVIFGTALIVLPILLAIVSRYVTRSRVILSTLISLILIAIAGQIWLGVLLINDGNAGPVTRFAPAESSR